MQAPLHGGLVGCPQGQQRSLIHHRGRNCLPRATSAVAPRLSNPPASTASGNTVNIHYRTGWSTAVLHGSLCGGPWTDYALAAVPSAPGKWTRAQFQFRKPTAPSKDRLLEFVLTNKKNDWDKPLDGTNYVISGPGSYVISGGTVNKVTGKRVMVVSDLDGTMVGDDTATMNFRQWWEDTAIPRGGVLVYNTGRSLESFIELQKEKAQCLARPDALISAVGTKIYEFDGKQWNEDGLWLDQLDEGWHLDDAREAAYRALAEVGKDRMHFRPPEEQNSHKVTCGVSASVLKPVLDVLKSNLVTKGVKANVITSGHGQWKYMDVVPVRAGKLSALNYVRKRHGFESQETVACGDSGNDILMLQGENPAIVVGNAQQDLREWYQSRHEIEPRANGPSGKQRLLMTNKPEALGILEGLAYWGFK